MQHHVHHKNQKEFTLIEGIQAAHQGVGSGFPHVDEGRGQDRKLIETIRSELQDVLDLLDEDILDDIRGLLEAPSLDEKAIESI